MIKIDLKDAYFSVPVSKQHQPLLRFLHKGVRYQFFCLPFGLGPAPRLFTKLLKPVVALLRKLGLRLIIYLDNIIVFNQTQGGILRDRDSTLWLLQHLGFVINWKKPVLHPARCMEYLGFVINSLEIKLFLPTEKMSQLLQDCKDLILEKSASARTVSHIIGRLTSTLQAVLLAPLHYMPERSPVVDRQTVDLEWEVNNLTSPRFDYYDGCVLEGLGGSVSGSSYQGALDSGGIITAYKCPRTQGSSFCFESFLQQSKETSCSSPNGQQNSSCIPT